MSFKRFGLTMLVMSVVALASAGGRCEGAASAEADEGQAKANVQIEVIKNGVLEGSSEENRMKAARVLLADTTPAARQALLDILTIDDKEQAKVAVCKVLSEARQAETEITNKVSFVEPLLGVLAGGGEGLGRLAAEATLMFQYQQIQEPLEQMVADPNVAPAGKLNAVYALSLHPDVGAAMKLIELIDARDEPIGAAALDAARDLGLDTGSDATDRARIVRDLGRKGQAAFLQERIIRQQAQTRRVEQQMASWRERYLAELGKRYDSIADDAAKGKFLAEHLAGGEKTVKLWALEKVRQSRVGTATAPKLVAELAEALLTLISDPDQAVRLKTARLLSLLGELNSAEQLLKQLGVEKNDAVRTELFVALGGACYHASLPNPGVKVAPAIRKETLDLALKFLSDTQDARKTREGADVIRKLLEHNGLGAEDVSKYLTALAERYKAEADPNNGALRAELIAAMAPLAGPRSFCRAEAAKLFSPIFESALADPSDAVRLQAVDGMIQIDKAVAMKRLRSGFASDKNAAIRARVVNLAGEVGTQEDLTWLAAKTGNGEAELAWQAMLKIFGRSGSAVLDVWVARLDGNGGSNTLKLTDEQQIQMLEIAEQKAVAEKLAASARASQQKLAALHQKAGDYEQAAGYLRKLHDSAAAGQEKTAIMAQLLDCYLRLGSTDVAANLVGEYLAKQDAAEPDPVLGQVAAFLSSPPTGADPAAVLKALQEVKLSSDVSRPIWQKQLQSWKGLVKPAEDPNDPKTNGS